MRTSAHLVDPITIKTHQDLKSEKRMRSLESVNTEKALASVPLLVLVSAAGASGIIAVDLDRLAHFPRAQLDAREP
jgi:hypothetical protein